MVAFAENREEQVAAKTVVVEIGGEQVSLSLDPPLLIRQSNTLEIEAVGPDGYFRVMVEQTGEESLAREITG